MEHLVHRISENVRVCELGPWMFPDTTLKPTGLEEGNVFVIGVGGSTIRLTEIVVSKSATSSTEIFKMGIPEEAKNGNIFAWCAAQIVHPLDQRVAASDHKAAPVVAISWSFPLSHCRIMSMGKSFGSRYNGQNLLDLFNAELPPQYAAQSATHDGTSSLVAGMHRSPNCTMALTLGTGVNLNVQGRDGRLINTEVSMLGRNDTTPNIELFTEKWDVRGPIAEFQPFETRVGGLYLSQMASSVLAEQVTTEKIWEILSDPTDPRFKPVDDIVVRAASLVAAAIYGLHYALASSGTRGPETVEVAYTGGVIFEREFRTRLETQLQKLAEQFPLRVSLLPLREGSEVGAAIAALSQNAGRQ